MNFKHFKSALDEVSQVLALSLAVVDLVAEVLVLDLEEVEHREDLSVVGHEGLADGVGAGDECLQDLQRDGDDFWVSGVQGSYTKLRVGTMLTLDGDDQLGNDWQHLGASLLEHVEYSLHSQESVWVLLLSDAFEEDGQVVMVVQLLDFHFPVDFILGTVLNGNWEISSIVESSKFTWRNVPSIEGASSWLLWCWLFLGLI